VLLLLHQGTVAIKRAERFFEYGERALMSADVREMERTHARGYVQSDESGSYSLGRIWWPIVRRERFVFCR